MSGAAEIAAKLMALAERCEAAPGPDRELDEALLRSAYVLRRGQRGDLGPHYTNSLDAALQLVGDEHWRVEVHPLAGPCAIVGEQEGYAATPALALCAAALRARAHLSRESGE